MKNKLKENNKLLTFLLVILAVILAISYSIVMNQEALETTEVKITQSHGENITLELKVFDTPSERIQGLQNVTELQYDGAIFVYRDSATRSFWMKNTYIPLDMIFIDSEKNIINIETAETELDTPESELTSYTSEEPARYVIEIESRKAQQENITTDSRIYID